MYRPPVGCLEDGQWGCTDRRSGVLETDPGGCIDY
jgi:hypothetical protein